MSELRNHSNNNRHKVARIMSQDPPHSIWQKRAIRERLAREKAEELLEEKSHSLYTASERLRLLFENTADGIIVHTDQGIIREINTTACKSLGYTRHELIGMSVSQIELKPLDQLLKIWNDWENLPELINGMHLRKDGTSLPVEVRLAKYQDSEETLFVALVRDITTRIENEKALRRLANKLTLVEEQNRRDFAVALHDNIAQTLAVTKYRITTLESMLSAESQKNEAMHIKSLLHEIILQTRQLMLDLSSPVLYESGVGAALRSHSRFLSEQYNCRFVLDDESLPEIDDTGIKVLIYQMARELMNNAAKHAKPSLVTARFHLDDGTLSLVVEDDGPGFPDDIEFRPGASNGYGLFSIRERVTHYGGDLQISDIPSGGSSVKVSIKLTH